MGRREQPWEKSRSGVVYRFRYNGPAIIFENPVHGLLTFSRYQIHAALLEFFPAAAGAGIVAIDIGIFFPESLAFY